VDLQSVRNQREEQHKITTRMSSHGRVDIFDHVTKVIQEYNVVVIHKYPEEFLVLLVGRHVQRRSLRKFGTQLVQLVRGQTRGGVLEVPPPDVHRIVYTFDSAGVVPFVLAGVIPHRLHDTRRGANDVVNVTQVIPNETFAPEILPPIREEDECWWWNIQ
jgi:hypothetical protein